jgi:BirA family biotin operon repressor/biotin-[acetyl-CoA-carboxylase] ligase
VKIIKLSAIDSTNSYLKRLVKEGIASDRLIITTENQTLGRGQQGASWEVQEGKSLAISILKCFSALPVYSQFNIAMATSLGVQKALQRLGILDVKIKWPNDILSDQKKLCGILIENIVKGSTIKETIVGIGLNVNETAFINLPNATSLKLRSGVQYKLNDVLNEVANAVLKELDALESTDDVSLKHAYESQLFRNNEVSLFTDLAGKQFNGTIIGVTEFGQLRIKTEDDIENQYSLKEITLYY